MTFGRVLLFTAAAAASCAFLIAACGDETSQLDPAPDAWSGPAVDGAPIERADGAAVVVDAGPDAADAADGSLFGTGKGLRVTFLGNEHTYGGEDETALEASFNEDTTLTASRAVNPTVDAAFLSDIDVLVLDRLARALTADEVTALETWVRAGHGVIAFGGFGGPDDAQLLLTRFGITRGSANLGNGTDYATMVADHPVAKGVSSLRVYGDQPITTVDDAGAPFALLGTNIIGLTVVADKGRVLTYGGDWVLFNVEVNRVDDAGAKPTRVFWHNALLWAGGRL